jgi:hypothetical protein
LDQPLEPPSNAIVNKGRKKDLEKEFFSLQPFQPAIKVVNQIDFEPAE